MIRKSYRQKYIEKYGKDNDNNKHIYETHSRNMFIKAMFQRNKKRWSSQWYHSAIIEWGNNLRYQYV